MERLMPNIKLEDVRQKTINEEEVEFLLVFESVHVWLVSKNDSLLVV